MRQLLKAFGLTVLAVLVAATMMFVTPTPAQATETFNTSLSAPGVYFGTGNANSGFTVEDTTNTDGSDLELGLEAILRGGGGGPITPTANDYAVPTGSSGNDALWNFVFSVNTGTDPLSEYVYNINILNLNTFASYNFSPTLLPDNAQVGVDACANNHAGCTYNGANDGMQNSENLGFSFLSMPLSFNPNAPDVYQITLSAVPTSGSNADPAVTILADASGNAAIPEPATFALMGIGLLGFGLVRRKLAK